MPKGGESLGNEESSEEEEEVIPALNHTPGVRPLAPGVVFLKDIIPTKCFQRCPIHGRADGLSAGKLHPSSA